LSSVVTIMVQKRGGELEVGASLPLSARVGNALVSYCRYLWKLCWPTDLAVWYPHPGQWPAGKVLLAAGLLLGVSALVWVGRRRYPYLLMGWLWYCGTLVPVCQVVQTSSMAMADRWSYIPSVGVLMFAVWGACELSCRWRYHELAWSVAAGAAIVLCLALTRQQLACWKDSEAMWRHAVEVTENNYMAHHTLGYLLGVKGQADEASRELQEAVRLAPDQPNAHFDLGVALNQKGQLDEAIRQFQEAIRLDPRHPDPYYNLAIVLGRKGQPEEAIRQFQEAIRLKPDYVEAHNNLGIALGRNGQLDESIREFQEATRLKQDYAEAHYNLSLVLALRGQTAEATSHFEEAVRLKPVYAQARKNLEAAIATGARSSPLPGASTNR
jgi:Flp pilus assembly protein TadD